MFERKLFLGLQVDSTCQEALEAVDKRFLELFIEENGKFLHRFTHQHQLYLGRFVDSPVELTGLELLREHIISLIKRLIPNYLYKDTNFWLLPVVNLST